MFARVTQFEIDTLRISLDDALERFRAMVLPEVRKQPGYQGVYVMRNREGQGVIVSLWETEADARAVESDYYTNAVRQFMTVYKQMPGREHYEIVLAEAMAPAPLPS
jgi:heme-degrading monooxygenase HmoA